MRSGGGGLSARLRREVQKLQEFWHLHRNGASFCGISSGIAGSMSLLNAGEGAFLHKTQNEPGRNAVYTCFVKQNKDKKFMNIIHCTTFFINYLFIEAEILYQSSKFVRPHIPRKPPNHISLVSFIKNVLRKMVIVHEDFCCTLRHHFSVSSCFTSEFW